MKKDKMPRKMKKRFKKLIAFYDERRKEYEQNNLNLFFGGLILKQLADLGISADDVENIKIKDGLNVEVKLKGSIRHAEIIIDLNENKEGPDNGNN